MATPTTLPASFVSGAVLTAAQMNNLRGAFRVLQVVQTVKSDTFSTASTTFVDVTGMSATITPSSTASKVLVVVQACFGMSGSNAGIFRLAGGNSGNYVGDTAGNRERATGSLYVFNEFQGSFLPIVYLDSPATTSATTYKLQAHAYSPNTLWLNRTGTDTDNSGFTRWASSITVMEISA